MKDIITADWHIRPDRPACRLDEDWTATTAQMIDNIMSFAEAVGGRLFINGDLFNGSQVPAWLMNMVLNRIRKAVIYAGNHDFKNRNLNEIENSSIGHILKNPRYQALIPEVDDGFVQYDEEVLVCHRLVFHPKDAGLVKFKNGISANTLIDIALEDFPGVRYIYIGDNHHRYDFEDRGVTVINPGSPMVFSANMIGEECGFYVLDRDTGDLQFHVIPDDPELMTEKYLRVKEERSEKVKEFITTLSDADADTLDFFETCDSKMEEAPKEERNEYEDIKSEIIMSKKAKGDC